MAQDQKRTARLGRGLTSLMAGLPTNATPETVEQGTSETAPRARLAAAPPLEVLTSEDADISGAIVRSIPVADIRPNPYQPRKQFDQRALDQLAASIAQDGVMQPILLRRRPDSLSQYELIAGERRWRAAQLAGLDVVPALVRELADQDTSEWALIENLQREDLNPIERAEAFAQLIDHYELSHEQVADRVGVDRTTITNTIRLLALHHDVQQFVRDGLLFAGQAKVLAGVTDVEAQRALAVKAVRDAWSVRQVEQHVRDLIDSTNPGSNVAKTRKARSAHTADLERQIAEQLGTKVRLIQGKKKGTGSLTIDFYTLEDFDDLLAKLGVKIEG